MNQFSNYAVSGSYKQKQVDYEIVMVPPLKNITLKVTPATQDNPRFFNMAQREYAKSRRKTQVSKRRVSAETLDQIREDDIRIFSRCVIVGWSGVVNDKGKTVPFCPDACRELLEILPVRVFDDIRNFCADIDNFVEDPIDEDPTEEDIEDLSGE